MRPTRASPGRPSPRVTCDRGRSIGGGPAGGAWRPVSRARSSRHASMTATHRGPRPPQRGQAAAPVVTVSRVRHFPREVTRFTLNECRGWTPIPLRRCLWMPWPRSWSVPGSSRPGSWTGVSATGPLLKGSVCDGCWPERIELMPRPSSMHCSTPPRPPRPRATTGAGAARSPPLPAEDVQSNEGPATASRWPWSCRGFGALIPLAGTHRTIRPSRDVVGGPTIRSPAVGSGTH
jgi:hypothetical protein